MTGIPAFRSVLVTLTVLLVHVGLTSRLGVLSVRPEPLLLLAIAAGIELEHEAAAFVGFLAGLANDLLSSTPMGIWALIGALLAVGAGHLRLRAFGGLQRGWPLFIVAMGSAAGLVSYAGLAFVIDEHPLPRLTRLATIVLTATAWNLIFAIPARGLVRSALREGAAP